MRKAEQRLLNSTNQMRYYRVFCFFCGGVLTHNPFCDRCMRNFNVVIVYVVDDPYAKKTFLPGRWYGFIRLRQHLDLEFFDAARKTLDAWVRDNTSYLDRSLPEEWQRRLT